MRAKEFIVEYKKYPTREYGGVTFTMMEKDGQLIVKALNDFGIAMGYVIFNMDGKELDPKDLEVEEKYQGQGIASTMYDYIKSQGFIINRSFDQTDAGRGFWDKHRGEDSYVWEDRGQGAAGIVLYAKDTGRYGLQQRSDSINDGGLWAAWGGGREPGESLEQCALRELAEEGGYSGPIKLKRIGENAKYVTFLGTVPHEFEPRPDDEWKDFCWVEAGDWPSPMHPGVASALKNIPVNESVPQPGASSGAPTQFAPGTQIQNQQMTAAQIIKSIPGVPYYNNVVDDWDAKDYSWGVTKKVIEYAEYLKQHPESLAKLPPIQVVNGEFKDGAHRVSAIWLLQQRMDPQNPLWKNAKLNVQFAQQNIDENFADGKVKGKSRPGRVKRSGASCAGSVTDLRAKAKKYGGEKGKMYHWCANMKSGKQKANEGSVEDLEKDLKDPHSYDAIDHMMQTVAQQHGISAKELHDKFVEKHGVIPDEWTKEQLDELTFLGSQCTKDCSGHRAGYAWSKARGGVHTASWSDSFNKGAELAAIGK